ncbi:serine/threonine-protein kinase [Aquabacterium sp.]|uniref:serine/threonine-protein kinase n=1 Tax=Aquabacterium sp. TaxID=1872578 RepID=UPI002BFD372F|nr:serine/threonine-protein kinase [Aquabacterium sp.]HSW08369.1 serine/threonine-protein kinase [Aquabacterium sp.]
MAAHSSFPSSAETSASSGHPAWIGRYRVQSRLGEGATSEVFLARDDFRDRQVAIKRVRAASHIESPENHYRSHFFDAEAALAGKLKHPNVVEIFDAVPDPVMPYLVMEYVPGVTLRRFCRADALLALDQIVEIGFKCAMALGYVSRQGLIHRDVKPANILALVEDGHVKEVKISDFGSVLDTLSDRTQVFRVGSLAYMSPEQLDGSTLDSRADLYSLAAVLYHLVAGRPPFDATTQAALMHQIYNGEPPALQLLREGVPPRMQAILERALSKNREQRHASWDEFAQEWSSLVANAEVPRGQVQDVLDSERFNLLRSLEFFAGFGDVELWEVVRRARWQRHAYGAALYRKGEEGSTFHIIAQGRIDVYRDGNRVAQLGSGTSVGEMAYLAPSPDLRTHAADVIVSEAATTVSFTPETMLSLSPGTRHLFDGAFIRVLVRRLHAAHEAMAHPRRIL